MSLRIKELLISCPMWMHHKEAASLLNATSVPCPLCLCMSSLPCPYKEVTVQRGWRGRSLPTGRAATVHRGSEAPAVSAHTVDSATELKSKFSKLWHTRQAFAGSLHTRYLWEPTLSRHSRDNKIIKNCEGELEFMRRRAPKPPGLHSLIHLVLGKARLKQICKFPAFLSAAANWPMEGLTVFLCVASVPLTKLQWNAAAPGCQRVRWFVFTC